MITRNLIPSLALALRQGWPEANVPGTYYPTSVRVHGVTYLWLAKMGIRAHNPHIRALALEALDGTIWTTHLQVSPSGQAMRYSRRPATTGEIEWWLSHYPNHMKETVC